MKDSPSAPEAPAPPGPVSLGVPPRAVRSRIEGRVRLACIASLVALGLIIWSLVDARPLPVIAAMTVGQVLGTLSLLLFMGSIALDIRARYKITERGNPTPGPPASNDQPGG